MPDSAEQRVKRLIARIWGEFIAVLRLISGDEVQPRARSCGQKPVKNGAEMSQQDAESGGANPDEEAQAETGLDEYFDEIDGFMEKIGEKPSGSGPTGGEEPKDQAGKSGS